MFELTRKMKTPAEINTLESLLLRRQKLIARGIENQVQLSYLF